MSGSSFGTLFRVSTFGESHGGCVGAVVDGCPPGLELSESDIQPDLDRRRPGQSSITTPRKETDTISILSGVFEGNTTGTPILLLAHNKDMRPEDYNRLGNLYRPSHADFTYELKYGRRDWRGSGRASARETLARVAAGAIARKYLAENYNVNIYAYVQQVGSYVAECDPLSVKRSEVEETPVRCPDRKAAQKMIKLIEQVRDDGDSIGGVVQCVATGVPAGLGEPVFDKLHADLGKGMLSINAVKGFEIGSGFSCATMRGSEHNDPYVIGEDGSITIESNRAGGVLGGISTGMPVLCRVAFKPVATILKEQKTVNRDGEEITFAAEGRHDPCVLPRAVPIVEAMAALVIMDHVLRHRAQNG